MGHPTYSNVEFQVTVHPRGQGAVALAIDPRTALYASSMDASNANHVGFSICAYLALLDDTPFGRCSKPLSVFRRLLRILTTDILHTISEYSAIADQLLKEPYEFHENIMRTPVAYEYWQWYTYHYEDVYTYLLTFFRFAKRIAFRRRDLQQTAFRGWCADEERLKGSLPDDVDHRILRLIVEGLIGSSPDTITAFRHGPGFTADLPWRDAYVKVRDMVWTRRTLLYVRGLQSPDPTRTMRDILERFTRIGPAVVTQPSKLTFVPKNFKTMRSICMEPTVHMLLQQGVLRAFRDAFKRPFTRRSIILENQSFNQIGAKIGSETLLLDTIDLSSASDLVGLDLVRAIFPPKWFIHLLGTRSSDVSLPDGTIRRVLKFAPMGSAVCFPVQCVIFLSVVYYCELEQALGDRLSEISSVSELLSKLSDLSFPWGEDVPPRYDRQRFAYPLVYGDDIICDSKITTRVMQRLESLRFRVNHDKSFTSNDPVRESCGKYYINGHDVTPLHLGTPFISGCLTAAHTASLQEQADAFSEAGYLSLRTFLFHFWKSNLPKEVDQVCRDVPYLHAEDAFFGNRFMRYNWGYQRWEACRFSAVAVNAAEPASEEFDAYSLFVWQHNRHRGDEAGASHSTRVPISSRHRLEWLPVA